MTDIGTVSPCFSHISLFVVLFLVQMDKEKYFHAAVCVQRLRTRNTSMKILLSAAAYGSEMCTDGSSGRYDSDLSSAMFKKRSQCLIKNVFMLCMYEVFVTSLHHRRQMVKSLAQITERRDTLHSERVNDG